MIYTNCKYPVGTRVRFVTPIGKPDDAMFNGVTGVITDPAELIMYGRPITIRPRNAILLDRKPRGWILDWCHASDAWITKAEPLTPFEENLVAYIESEKRTLGLL